MELQPAFDFDIDALLGPPSSAENTELELQRLKKNICILKSKIHNYNVEERKEISPKRELADSQVNLNSHDSNELNDLYRKFDNIIIQKNELLQQISEFERINSGNESKPKKSQFGDKREVPLNNINGKEVFPEVVNTKKAVSVGESEDVNKAKYSLNFVLAKKSTKETAQQTNKIMDVLRSKIEDIMKGVTNPKYCINVDIELQDKFPITARNQNSKQPNIADNIGVKKEKKQEPKQCRDVCTNTEASLNPKNVSAEENVITKKNEILIKFVKSLMTIRNQVIAVQCQNVLKRISGLDRLEKFDNEFEQQSLFSPCSATDVETLTSEDERDSVDSGLMSPYNNTLMGNGCSPLPSSNLDSGGFNEQADKIDNIKQCKTNSNLIELDPINTESVFTPKGIAIKTNNMDHMGRTGNSRFKRKKGTSNVLIPGGILKVKSVSIGLDPIKELNYKHEIKTVNVGLDPIKELIYQLHNKTVNVGLDPIKELIDKHQIKTVNIGLDPIKELIDKHQIKTVDVALEPIIELVKERKVKTVNVALDPIKEVIERQVKTVNVGLSPINEIRIKTTDVSLSPIKELTKVSTKTVGLNPIKKLRIRTTDVSLSPIKEIPKTTTCTIGLNPIKELQKENVNTTYTCKKCKMDYSSSAVMSLMEMEMENIQNRDSVSDNPSTSDIDTNGENALDVQNMLSEMNLDRALSPINTSEQLIEHAADDKKSYVREVLSDIVLELMTEHYRKSAFSMNMQNRDICQRHESLSIPNDEHNPVNDKTNVESLSYENVQHVTSGTGRNMQSPSPVATTSKSNADNKICTERESELNDNTYQPNTVKQSRDNQEIATQISKRHKTKKLTLFQKLRRSRIVKHKIRPVVPLRNCRKIVKQILIKPNVESVNLNNKILYEKAAKVAADFREKIKQKSLTPRKTRKSLNSLKTSLIPSSLRDEADTSFLSKDSNNDHIATSCTIMRQTQKELLKSLFGAEDDGELSPNSLTPNKCNLDESKTPIDVNSNSNKHDNESPFLMTNENTLDDNLQAGLRTPNSSMSSTSSETSTPTSSQKNGTCRKLFQNGNTNIDTSPSRYSLRNKTKINYELFGEGDDSTTSIIQPVIMSTEITSNRKDTHETVHIPLIKELDSTHLPDKIKQNFSECDDGNDVARITSPVKNIRNNRKRSLSMSNEIESKRVLKVVLDRTIVKKTLSASVNSAKDEASLSSMENNNNNNINKSANPKELTEPALISYEDLSVFNSDNIQPKRPKSNIKHNTKSSHKDNVFCMMLEKYGRHSLQKAFNPDKNFAASVEAVCNELEYDIQYILALQMTSQMKTNMITLANKIMNVDKRVFLSSILKYLLSDKRKTDVICKRYTPPAPAMTKPEQVLLFILNTLKTQDNNIISDVLANIEYTLFRLNNTPDFEQVDLLSHFYAVLCRFIGNKRRLRMFMLDAMYCLSFKATNLIQQCLEVWMNVLPLAHLNSANTPLVTCFVYLLHFFKCEDYCDRVLNLRRTLHKTYAYNMNKWNQKTFLEYLKNCFVELKGNTFEEKTLKMCLLILAKRHGTQWCEKNIVNSILLPFIEDTSTPDNIRAFCVSVLGALMRPYPVDMKLYVDIAINKLSIILGEKCSQRLEEAVITSLVQISKQYPARVMRIIMAWQPQFDLTKELEECLCEFIRHRPIAAWINLFGSR